MLDEGIYAKLRNTFESSRVVFWEDASSEFADDIEGLELEGVKVAVVAGNEV